MIYLVKNYRELITCATDATYFDALRREMRDTEIISEAEYLNRTKVVDGGPIAATGDVVVL